MRNGLDKYLIEKKRGSPRLFRISKIEEFIELVTWLSSDDHVVFRGQRRNLPLIPVIGRNPERRNWFSTEKEVIEEFKREALPYSGFTPTNDWQWLAVAQHNRLPTHFLDWTRSPLAALWFTVCKPANEGEPGSVWGFIYETTEAICSTKDLPSPFSIDNTLLYFPEYDYICELNVNTEDGDKETLSSLKRLFNFVKSYSDESEDLITANYYEREWRLLELNLELSESNPIPLGNMGLEK